MTRTLDQVIREVKSMQLRRNTGEGVFIGDANIIDEILDFLKEARGLKTYQLQLGSELRAMETRHRKFTTEAAIAVAAGNPVFPVKVPPTIVYDHPTGEEMQEAGFPGGMAQALTDGYLGGSPQNDGLDSAERYTRERHTTGFAG